MGTTSESTSTAKISWNCPEEQPPPPIIAYIPYVEMKLEHPDLEPNLFGNSFFPDAIPYQLSDNQRIFYWRPSLSIPNTTTSTWDGVCATTHALTPISNDNVVTPRLSSRRESGYEVVVDGTVAGDSLTTIIKGYRPPQISVQRITPAKLKCNLPAETVAVTNGANRTIELSEQSGCYTNGEQAEFSVTPTLYIRYPGQRTVYHPNPEEEYALFPSFGLDLGSVPNPVAVPIENGELDYIALASELGVELTDRPYPERVLWQAFAYHVFDPHRERQPRLLQTEQGLLLLTNPQL